MKLFRAMLLSLSLFTGGLMATMGTSYATGNETECQTRASIEKQISDYNNGETFDSIELTGDKAKHFSVAYTKTTGSIVPEGMDNFVIYNMGDGTALVTGYTAGCFNGAARIPLPLFVEISKTAEDLQVNN